MTRSEYLDICRRACYALDIADPEGMFDGEGVMVDGVTVGVYFDDDTDDSLFFYADIGLIEDGPEKVCKMERLMIVNLELTDGDNEAIAMERETNHFLLRARIPCDNGFDEQTLAETLTSYAALVNELREKILA